jgi:hypothetical protein
MPPFSQLKLTVRIVTRLVPKPVNRFSYSAEPRATRLRIAATNKTPPRPNQKISLSPAGIARATPAAMTTPIITHSPPRIPRIKAIAPIIEPPFYFSLIALISAELYFIS